MNAKWKYILAVGVPWGLLTVLLMAAWESWVQHRPFSLNHFIVLFLIWQFAGVVYGILMWRRRTSPRKT
jgi:hypothetical protein